MAKEIHKESIRFFWAIMWRWTVVTAIILLPVFYLESIPHSMEASIVYALIEIVITFITFYIAIYWILTKGYGKSKIIINHKETFS